MLGHNPFYHRIIRKHVSLFGSLFNDIFIERETVDGLTKKERIKCPLAYAPKEKFVTKLFSDPTLTKSIATTLPRLSFEILSMNYDSARKQQSSIKHRVMRNGIPVAQYVGIPYNIDFGLSLYVRNIEDGLQVVEQILPFFTPDYTISATLSEELGIVKDIPIILTSVHEENNYQGSFEDGTRMITWDFQFTAKTYLFGPTSNTTIIMGVSANTQDPNAAITGGIYVNLYTDSTNPLIQKIVVTGGSIDFKESEIIREPNLGITGKVYAWVPSTNTLYLTQSTGTLLVNNNIWGLETGAHWTVQSTELVPQKDAEIWIYQNPITANANTDYGYTTYITEYPDTVA